MTVEMYLNLIATVRNSTGILLLAGSLLLFSSQAYAVRIQHPPEGKEVKARHVLFAWEPDERAASYQLQVAIDDGEGSFENPTVEKFPATHAIITRRGVRFGRNYIWRIRGVTGLEDTLQWSNLHRFSTVALPDSIRHGFIPDTINIELMQPGISLITPYGIPSAIKANGEVIWYTPGPGGWWNAGQWDIRQLPDGNFTTLNQRTIRLFNVYNDTLWTNRDSMVTWGHHAAYRRSNGNFMTIYADSRRMGVDDTSRVWRGDRIVEITPEFEIVWEWSCWDYLSTEDFDLGFYEQVPPGGLFDWTHSNAIAFDEGEENIYLSVRNLSRIIKIAYPSGEIVWSMGSQMPSGDVDFGENLDFHKQHATEPLTDGTLLFYDNHWTHGTQWSRAMIVNIDPEREEPAQIVREHRIPFSSVMGSAYMQPNDNILINSGSSFEFYEFTPDSQLVWQMHSSLSQGSYRMRRIPGLYPLVFTIEGPADSSLIPSLNTYVPFEIHNVGEARQTYRYSISDSREWLDGRVGEAEIAPGRMGIIAAGGFVPQVDLWDEITFIVWPLVAPELAETLLVVVQPGEPEAIDVRLPNSPSSFQLYPGMPNPFNHSTQLKMYLPGLTQISIVIYDMQGRVVMDFPEKMYNAGLVSLAWNGKDRSGRSVTAGGYVFMVSDGDSFRRQIIHFIP